MNVALVFAGGTGIRMNSRSKPKQFLEFMGKPLIIYTLDRFDTHPNIDKIAVVCLKGWEDELKRHLNRWMIQKVEWIITGGLSSQESIRLGLQALENSAIPQDSIVLIHDGVRPLIDHALISDNIKCVSEKGNCITVAKENETFLSIDDAGMVSTIGSRSIMRVAKAPQSFWLGDILDVHRQAYQDGNSTFIDSASLMFHYGHKLNTVECDSSNIKVTTASDFYIFKALYESVENRQLSPF